MNHIPLLLFRTAQLMFLFRLVGTKRTNHARTLFCAKQNTTSMLGSSTFFATHLNQNCAHGSNCSGGNSILSYSAPLCSKNPEKFSSHQLSFATASHPLNLRHRLSRYTIIMTVCFAEVVYGSCHTGGRNIFTLRAIYSTKRMNDEDKRLQPRSTELHFTTTTYKSSLWSAQPTFC